MTNQAEKKKDKIQLIAEKLAKDYWNFKKGKQAREKEILEIIDKIDTEKYIGEYCFKANLFKKELKQKIKGEK